MIADYGDHMLNRSGNTTITIDVDYLKIDATIDNVVIVYNYIQIQKMAHQSISETFDVPLFTVVLITSGKVN